MNLLQCYNQYYKNPTLESAKLLWQEIQSYNFCDYVDFASDVKAAREDCKNFSSISLRTNGSTNIPREYKFGPFFDFWINSMESAIKPSIGKTIYIQSMFPCGDKKNAIMRVKDNSLMDYAGIFYWDQNNALSFLINFLHSVKEPITISTVSNTLLFLLEQKSFLEFLKQDKILAIRTLDWEPFFKSSKIPSSIHLNNNMVDWSITSNFYTCPFRTLHFFPTFSGNTSLINLANNQIESDDLFEINPQVRVCNCGKSYLNFKFIPHVNNAIKINNKIIYEPSFIEKLDSCYLNLQFVQTGQETIDILYIGNISQHDKDAINTLFEGRTNFVRNKYLVIGRKLICFYRNSNNIPYQSYSGITIL
ncbi:MAG: hypothetical protein M0R80_01745 [Proteobacteria bacterium]|jgi:hypothetical protein|nr:hypothetical protein [Pseudomonadota bacterium]